MLRQDEWRPFLKRWSEEWIAVQDPEQDAPLEDDVVRAGWLGFAPASTDEIVAAEQRLGRSLPPSLHEFLLVSNGWRNAGNFIHRLAGAGEIAWLRDTDDAHWIDAYGSDGMLRRALRLSVGGDSAVLLLDPDDVGADGEWAGYWLASWSGTGPERHGSFGELMRHLYAGFHALRRPPGQTRDLWDARVEQARLAALGGDVDGAAATLEQAQAFGQSRAALLRFQLRAMLRDWYTVSLASVVLLSDDREPLAQDPVFAAELLPLLFVEDRLTHRRERLALDRLAQTGPEPIQRLVADYAARFRQPGFRPTFGNPEFDAAVGQILEGLTAQRAGVERRRLIDTAWPPLREAMTLWRPVGANHIAPVVLFADPVLAETITPDRGRKILSTPRGGHQ
jgi:hypothetical protein